MRMPFLLLADDDEDDRFLFSEATRLIDPNIACIMVSNGKQLMALLENDFFSLPDYIFLDLNMPVMNGWDCLAAIRAHPVYRSCIVIIYSTTLTETEKEQLVNAGAFACFIKPTRMEELVNLLKEFCAL